MRRCLRVLVLEGADMGHAFDHRDRRGDIVLLVVISIDDTFKDTERAISLASDPITNSNSKHIDVRHLFFRVLVEMDMRSR